MRFHTAEIRDPMDKVRNGISYLNFLSQAVPEGSLYQSVIKMELSQFAERTAENIFHDDFAELNQPFYFHEFVEHIQPYGLQFLTEVDAFWMESGGLSSEILEKLDELGDDIIRREQYIDFIKCRPFRSTIICHDNIVLDRHPTPDILKNFYLASQARPESESPNIDKEITEKFTGPEGGTLEVDHPLTKAALICLENIWSKCVPFDKLIDEARQIAPEATESDIRKTAFNLLQMFHDGFVYLHRFQPQFASEAGEFPMASAFARWQVRCGSESITTLSGMNLKPDSDFMRLLLILADGTRNRAALISEMAARIEVDRTKKAELKRELPRMVDAKLLEITKLGLILR